MSDFAFLSTMVVLFAVTAGPGRALNVADADGDGIPDVIEQKVGTPQDAPQVLKPIAASPNQGYGDEQSQRNAPDIVAFSGCHVGGNRLLFKIRFAQKPIFVGASLIIYMDLDNDSATGRVDRTHGGVDAMLVFQGDSASMGFHNFDYTRDNTLFSAAIHEDSLFVSLDGPWKFKDGKLKLGLHLLTQRSGGASDTTRHSVAEFTRNDHPVPTLPQRRSDSLRSLADYRYHNDRVKYERLADKGLRYDQVASPDPMQFGRPRPPVPFSAARTPNEVGVIRMKRIRVDLLEEAGVDRVATSVSFGFPLPQGGLFDLKKMRVLAVDGQEIPAQFIATSFWPDDSLKWVLVDFQTNLAGDQQKDVLVEFGEEVECGLADSPLRFEESDDAIQVHTGAIDVVLDKKHFNTFREVSRSNRLVARSTPTGVALRDEHGRLYCQSAAPPRSIAVEEVGPLKIVVRVEGDYANDAGETYMSYVTRLLFRRGSPRVTVAHTHVNTYVETEFTDITSLSMPLALGGDIDEVFTCLPGDPMKLTKSLGGVADFRVTHWDEHSYLLGERMSDAIEGKHTGIVGLRSANDGVNVVVHEFWQRWPKAVSSDGAAAAIELLPQQPDADFGSDLPFWLMFPFVEGKYRFKWGMSFTARATIDFAAATSLEQLHADANLPIVAVLPAEWCASTAALGDLAAPAGYQFAEWDAYVQRGYERHMAQKDTAREYGYFNYGDWYGERNRNWGNNEYDLAHGFFMQFARTGRRDYQRLALAAARHQADVDCVHAYPDPHYLGANHQHSIGHTGTWSQNPVHATWSHRYDGHTDGRNGHTWTDGMMEAWYLTGDARVMEACLGVAEHITWAMAPSFDQLGTHERSAGWSLAAVLAVYRGTYDPKYLAAAKRIVAVPLKEQKFDDGGAWPHILPYDHSGGHPGARGNNLFLMGVLLAGLKDYHEVTGDPAVARSLVSGARWVLKSWDEGARGWPYSASTSGESYYDKVTPSLNMLIVEGVAYAGKLTGEDEFMRVAEAGFAATSDSTPPSSGKSVAQQMHFAAGLMGLLQHWHNARSKPRQDAP